MLRAPGSLAAQLRWVREHWTALIRGRSRPRPPDRPRARRPRRGGARARAEGRRRPFRRARSSSRRPTTAASTPTPSASRRTPSGCPASCSWPSRRTSGSSSSRRRHGRAIPTLADVPDEELDRLAELGRHRAVAHRAVAAQPRRPREIKRRRGDLDAVASAYAIDEYRIADDLGGEAAFEDLRGRAWARGIRLAADMVPNHMGIDSRWVVEHPERFIAVPGAAVPRLHVRRPGPVAATRGSRSRSRTTTGTARTPRSSSGGATAESGEQRFIYHGNDGTSYPWNDTAQLDYLRRRRPRGGHPDDPRRRATLPDHPVRRRDGPRAPAHPPALVPGARRRRRDPVPRRARALDRGVQPAHARGVLARGRRPRRRRGARDAAPRRGVLAARGLLRADPRACTASTTRRSCTCSATRTTRATGRSCATRSSSTRACSAGS